MMTEREITKLEGLLTSMRIEQAERFARMEANLEAFIATQAAMRDLVARLDARVRDIEINGTPHMHDIMDRINEIKSEAAEDVSAVKGDLDDISKEVSSLGKKAAGLTAVTALVVVAVNVIAPAVRSAIGLG